MSMFPSLQVHVNFTSRTTFKKDCAKNKKSEEHF